jgi:hypothetical protein
MKIGLTRWHLGSFSAALVCAGAVACSSATPSSESNSNGGAHTGPTTTGSSSTSSALNQSGASTTQSAGSSTATGDSGAGTLPVEPTFNPGGYFDKDHADIGSKASCPDVPADPLSTQCRTWTYTPNPSADGANGEYFAGVYWLYGNQNWGTMPGAPIPSGYTSVTFWAKGAQGGEQVSFWVGGLKGTPNADAFQAPMPASNGAVAPTTLTNAWAKYTISLLGVDYSGGVLGGFAWSASYDAEAGAPSPVTFYLGGVQWQ